MEAVVIYLTNTPAPEVPTIQDDKITMELDFLISFSLTSSFQTFIFFILDFRL